MKPAPPAPDFRSPAFLRDHVLRTMAFYDGRCLDPAGGFFHFFKDDGQVYDRTTRHLVSSTRFVITHAMASRAFPQHPRAGAWHDAASHGLRFVREVHRDGIDGGYDWMLRFEGGRRETLDATRHCYGLAFVLLAHAHAAMAGVPGAREGIAETAALMESRFWETRNGLYADEAAPGEPPGPYRGQNANMHACEAMLAAHAATGHTAWLERAATLADSVTERLASHASGLVWEHWQLDADGRWQPDWHYNRHDRSNIFRPWGFQTGHLAEWAKLLLQLDARLAAHAAQPECVPATEPVAVPVPSSASVTQRTARARALFDAAMQHGWDHRHGGLVYGFAGTDDAAGRNGRFVVCDGQKYHWVQAESLAAAALLAVRTGEPAYWQAYDRLWAYAWKHFVDHTHGAWFRILGDDNRTLTDDKSPAGKVDYHNMGACFDVLAALGEGVPAPH